MLPKPPVQTSQLLPTLAAPPTPSSMFLPAAPTSGRLASVSWASSLRAPTQRAGPQVRAVAAWAAPQRRTPYFNLCQWSWGSPSKARTRTWAVWWDKMSQSSRLWPVWSRWISTYKLCFKCLFPPTILVKNIRNSVLRCYVMAVKMLNTVMLSPNLDTRSISSQNIATGFWKIKIKWY